MGKVGSTFLKHAPGGQISVPGSGSLFPHGIEVIVLLQHNTIGGKSGQSVIMTRSFPVNSESGAGRRGESRITLLRQQVTCCVLGKMLCIMQTVERRSRERDPEAECRRR